MLQSFGPGPATAGMETAWKQLEEAAAPGSGVDGLEQES